MKRVAEGTNTGLLVAIVILGLAILNVAAHRFFVRADLTAKQEYTITPSTKRVLGELTDLVSVDVYFTRDLPPYLITLQRRTTDLLEDMRAYAGDNLRVEVTDPASDPKLEAKVRSLGIPQIQLQVIEKDQASVRNAYLGIAVQFEDRHEVIPVVRPEGLEYDLVSSILKVTRNEEKTIGMLTSGERSLEAGFSRVKELLDREYQVREISAGAGEPIPEEVSTLIVPGPTGLSERDAYEIDQFVMRGGSVVFMLDPIADPIQVLSGARGGAPTRSGVENLIQSYGLSATKEVVVDPASHALISYMTAIGGMQFQTTRPYPFFAKLTSASMSRSNPVVSELENLVLPWCAPLGTVEPLPEGIAVDTLGFSSEKSWVQAGRVTFSPQARLDPPDPERQRSFALGVVASGRFHSHYADKEVPPGEGDADAATAAPTETPLTESPETRVVLLGTSYVIDDNMLAQYPENAAFFLNLVDWLTLGDELIGIRSREVTDRPLKQLSDRARTAIRVLGIIGTPILVILFGLFRVLARRRLSFQGAAS